MGFDMDEKKGPPSLTPQTQARLFSGDVPPLVNPGVSKTSAPELESPYSLHPCSYDSISIRLSRQEMKVASEIGCLRQIENMGKRQNKFEGGPGDFQAHINGAAGEMVVCSYLDFYYRFWDFDGDDAGPYQVRTRPDDRLQLPIYLDTKPKVADTPFILVTGVNGNYTIRGWMTPREAFRKEWWGKPRGRGMSPAFFVPQDKLHRMKDLPNPEESP